MSLPYQSFMCIHIILEHEQIVFDKDGEIDYPNRFVFLSLSLSLIGFISDAQNATFFAILANLPLPPVCIMRKGTLSDCMPALRTWCSEMTCAVKRRCDYTDGISNAHAERIVSDFHASIGWNATANDLMPSAPLSAATWDEIVGISATSLRDSGLTGIGRDEVQIWHRGLGDIHAGDPPLIDDVADLFRHFRRRGILISICTSDDRASTDACMRRWNVSDLVDFSICGDEVGAGESKPSPRPLLELCRRAGGGITPRECLVVGDTRSDTEMGRRSGAGFVVGVLTGSGTAEQLIRTGADIVLPHVGHLRYLLLSQAAPKELVQ